MEETPGRIIPPLISIIRIYVAASINNAKASSFRSMHILCRDRFPIYTSSGWTETNFPLSESGICGFYNFYISWSRGIGYIFFHFYARHHWRAITWFRSAHGWGINIFRKTCPFHLAVLVPAELHGNGGGSFEILSSGKAFMYRSWKYLLCDKSVQDILDLFQTVGCMEYKVHSLYKLIMICIAITLRQASFRSWNQSLTM